MVICQNTVLSDRNPLCLFWVTHWQDFCLFISMNSVKEYFFFFVRLLCPSPPPTSFLIYPLFLVIKPFNLAKWNYIPYCLIYFAASLTTSRRHPNFHGCKKEKLILIWAWWATRQLLSTGFHFMYFFTILPNNLFLWNCPFKITNQIHFVKRQWCEV